MILRKMTGIRLMLHAITDRKHHFVAAAGINHSLTFGLIHSKRLFTPHMLASVGSHNGEIFMRTRGGDHINHVDVIVIGNVVHCPVGIRIFIRDTIL